MNQLPETRQRAIGCVMSIAIVAAPFIALFFGLTIALAVLVVALIATSWLGWQALREAPPEIAPRLRIAVLVNLVLVVVAIAVLVWVAQLG